MICEVAGCTCPVRPPHRQDLQHRIGKDTLCNLHRTNRARYGHPLACAVRVSHRPFKVARIERWISKHATEPLVAAALGVITALKQKDPELVRNIASRRRPAHPSYDGEATAARELERLRRHRVPEGKVLARVLACWYFLDRIRPDLLPDDGRCVTFALGHALLGCAPKLIIGFNAKKNQNKTRAAPGRAAFWIGQQIRTKLARVYLAVRDHLDAERKRAGERGNESTEEKWRALLPPAPPPKPPSPPAPTRDELRALARAEHEAEVAALRALAVRRSQS